MTVVRRVSLVTGVTMLVVGIPALAGASGITPAPKPVTGAFANVSSCGTLSGVGISWTSTANVVTAVSLTSIPSACVGGSLAVTFVGSGNAALGSAGPLTIAGTSQTLTSITGSPTATSVTGAYVAVVGP